MNSALLLTAFVVACLFAASVYAQSPPPNEPINTWVLKTRAPNHVYENDLAYDPVTGQVVYHGGHVGRLYPQSNYTFLYDVSANRWRESQSPYRPQRRCYADMAYLDCVRRCLTGHGSKGHGSLPQGGFSAKYGNYKECYRELNVGPWLYDGVEDVWTDARPLPPKWANKDLANICYEPNSAVCFYFYHDQWAYYCPRTNRITVRYAPKELAVRSGYAVAADPLRRKIVFFGGLYYGPAANAADRYKADTWIYDIAADKWRQAHPKTSPPSGVQRRFVIGLEMAYHHPSGTMLMLVNPVQGVPPKVEDTPPAELWSFDAGTEEWTKIDLAGDVPATTGIAVYAKNEDLLVQFGGGSDSTLRDYGREVRTCRVRIEGKTPTLPAAPEKIRVETDQGKVTVAWQPNRSTTYDVYRAECEGLSGKTSTMYSMDSPEVRKWIEYRNARAANRSAFTQPAEYQSAMAKLGPDPWGPDVDPVPGEYVRINKLPLFDSFVDDSIVPGAVYAYQVVPSNAPANQLRSLPAFNQPWHPTGLRASVEDAKKVVLRWDANKEADLVGYKVYRAIGAEIETATGRLLTPEPVPATEFAVTDDDLSDKTVRIYWVTAVNRGGIESGASPLAYSFPDAPTGFKVVWGEGPSNIDGLLLGYRIGWEWPRDVKVAGFNVYYSNHHRNGYNGPSGTYDADWKKLTKTPIAENEFVFSLDRDDPVRNYYFHVRAVNVLGQEGFYTDILSPTDFRFRQ